MKHENDKAITDLTKAIRLYPKYAMAYKDRGNAWRSKNDPEKARADFNEAVRLEPRNPLVFQGRGFLWYTTKEYDKAITDANEWIKLDPKRASAFECRASSLLAKGDLDEALADLDKAIQLDRTDARAFDNRGSIWYRKKEYDRAIADYREFRRLDPKAFETTGLLPYYAEAHALRARDRLVNGEYDMALADFDEAIRLDPNAANPYGIRAWTLATCPIDKYRDGKKAVELAIRACDLSEWKENYHLQALAATYAESGNFDKAVKMQEKALEPLGEGEEIMTAESRLDFYKEKKPYRDEF
jgi:tetratricopeptide (TPR) repeat protein